MDADLAFAKELQAQFDTEYFMDQTGSSHQQAKYYKDVDPNLELEDPVPNIYELFTHFNAKYFEGKLGSVEVKWSNRMYSCAGTCSYRTGAGCVVTLSAPLLKFRPRKDLVETLLHEMIHAYLFVAYKNAEHEEHGPMFHELMHKINKASGANITVYHTFHDEVQHHKTHWWRCNGPCKNKHPYFGIVKRSSNRAPGPNDFWFSRHNSECGGEFIKIKEPDGFKSRKTNSSKVKSEKQKNNFHKFFETIQDSKSVSGVQKNQNNIHSLNTLTKITGTINKNKTASPKTLKNLHGFKNQSNFSPVQSSSTSQNFSTNGQSKINDWTKPNRNFIGKVSPQNSAVRKPGSSIRNFNHGQNNVKFPSVAQGLVSNRGGTLLERPKTVKTSISADQMTRVKETTCTVPQHVPFSGNGHLLDPNCNPSEINRANSKLLKLFSDKKSDSRKTSLVSNGNFNSIGCEASSHDNGSIGVKKSQQLPKLSEDEFVYPIKPQEYNEEENIVIENVDCPICGSEYSMEKISKHVDECLENNNFIDI